MAASADPPVPPSLAGGGAGDDDDNSDPLRRKGLDADPIFPEDELNADEEAPAAGDTEEAASAPPHSRSQKSSLPSAAGSQQRPFFYNKAFRGKMQKHRMCPTGGHVPTTIPPAMVELPCYKMEGGRGIWLTTRGDQHWTKRGSLLAAANAMANFSIDAPMSYKTLPSARPPRLPSTAAAATALQRQNAPGTSKPLSITRTSTASSTEATGAPPPHPAAATSSGRNGGGRRSGPRRRPLDLNRVPEPSEDTDSSSSSGNGSSTATSTFFRLQLGQQKEEDQE